MKISAQHHLTYCTNIHPGESWPQVWQSLKKHLPAIKEAVSPQASMGVGLRLSNDASEELLNEGLAPFQDWLQQEDLYVFTLNGFPYGNFHRKRVKDQVHQPDWTSTDRLQYTLRLFEILSKLLPRDTAGGISTSPLSYKPWLTAGATEDVLKSATTNLVKIAEALHHYHQHEGVFMHLDLEPEPDGLLENSRETIAYFEDWLLPEGIRQLTKSLSISADKAREIILSHIQVCYDVCHFAVGYESPAKALRSFKDAGVQIGKVQISAALKKDFDPGADREVYREAFQSLDEPVYLHQVVARKVNGGLTAYRDLMEAFPYIEDPEIVEWRTHFHVPVFVESYGILESTQSDILEVLEICNQEQITDHLEVETYTWEVLPGQLQTAIDQSIARELQWVLEQVNRHA